MKKTVNAVLSIALASGIMFSAAVPSFAAEYVSPALNASVSETVASNRDQELIAAEKLAEKLNGKAVEITAEKGVDGRLFGSVTSKEISAEIEKEFDVVIDKRKIEAPEIKATGRFDIRINLYSGVVCRMTVVVE